MVSKVGLALGRFQPLHQGHCRAIFQMMMDCHQVVVGVGSAQEKGTENNPFDVETRMQMLKNVFGDGGVKRIKIVPFNDIGTQPTSNSWIDYVFEKLKKIHISDEPTDYYTGRDVDSIYYKGRFWPGMMTEILNAPDGQINESMRLRYGLSNNAKKEDYFTENGNIRMLHTIGTGQEFMNIRSGTEIRKYLSHGDGSWRQFVPKVNHKLVNETFPNDLKVTKW